MSICEHAPAANPRLAGTCVKCGRPLPPSHSRDREFESQIIQAACRGITDPAELIELAQQRADEYGDELRPGKNWLAEAAEEAPDLVNYLVWEYQKRLVSDDLDSDAQGQLVLAISEAATVFERIRYLMSR